MENSTGIPRQRKFLSEREHHQEEIPVVHDPMSSRAGLHFPCSRTRRPPGTDLKTECWQG